MINRNYDQLRTGRLSGLTSDAEKLKLAEQQAVGLTKNARALGELEKSTMTATKGMGSFGRGMGSLLGSMTLTAGTAAKTGGGLLARGAGAIASSPMMAAGAAGYRGLSPWSPTCRVRSRRTSTSTPTTATR